MNKELSDAYQRAVSKLKLHDEFSAEEMKYGKDAMFVLLGEIEVLFDRLNAELVNQCDKAIYCCEKGEETNRALVGLLRAYFGVRRQLTMHTGITMPDDGGAADFAYSVIDPVERDAIVEENKKHANCD